MDIPASQAKRGLPVKANPKAMRNAIQYVFCQLLVWVVSKQYMPLVQARLKG